jgi:hypothetical protein
VSRNGRRRPPKPRIELITPAPSRGEAAAIAAAIERFVADTMPPPAPEPPLPSAWQRAALREGVEARFAFASAWGSQRGGRLASGADSG